MNPAIKLDMTVGTFQALTVEQFKALQQNVMGGWDQLEPVNFPSLRISGGGDYVGVHLDHGFFIGIEKDGYTHS